MNTSNTSSPRREVLEAASAAVLQDRNASYGPPESNFQDIADVWNWYHGKSGTQQFLFTAMDVANMMILMKMARLKYNPNHRDSKVDVAGYAACAAECEATVTAPAKAALMEANKTSGYDFTAQQAKQPKGEPLDLSTVSIPNPLHRDYR